MNFCMKTVIAATAVSLGLAAAPVSAQVLGYDRGVGADRGIDYEGRPLGYHDDGTLNVFGAHIEPRGGRSGGLIGGVGNAVGGVVGGVGSAVGGVVGGAVGVADDVITGSIGERGVGRARLGAAGDYDRPVSGYGRPTY